MKAIEVEIAGFKTLKKTIISQVKRWNTLSIKLSVVLKKLANRALIETEKFITLVYCNTRLIKQQNKKATELMETTKVNTNELSSVKNPMKTLMQTTIKIIKCAKDKIITYKSYTKKVVTEYNKIIIYINVIHLIKDEIKDIKQKLQEIKQAIKNF